MAKTVKKKTGQSWRLSTDDLSATRVQMAIRALSRVASLWEQTREAGQSAILGTRDARLLEEVTRLVERHERSSPTVEDDEIAPASDLAGKLHTLSAALVETLEARKRKKMVGFDAGLLDEVHETVETFGFRVTRYEVGTRTTSWFKHHFGDEAPDAAKNVISAANGPKQLAVYLLDALKLVPGSSAASQYVHQRAYRKAAKIGRVAKYRDLCFFMLICLDVPSHLAQPLADLLRQVRFEGVWSDTQLDPLRYAVRRGSTPRRLSQVAFRPADPE